MKKHAYMVFTILSLFVLVTVAPVFGQYIGKNVVKIPFEFVAGNKTLPAGKYTIRPISTDAPAMLLIESLDGSMRATVSTHSIQASEMQAETKLVFNRYGRQYFLSRVWTPGSDRGRELFKSHVECELVESGSEKEIVAITGNQPGLSLKK